MDSVSDICKDHLLCFMTIIEVKVVQMIKIDFLHKSSVTSSELSTGQVHIIVSDRSTFREHVKRVPEFVVRFPEFERSLTMICKHITKAPNRPNSCMDSVHLTSL